MSECAKEKQSINVNKWGFKVLDNSDFFKIEVLIRSHHEDHFYFYPMWNFTECRTFKTGSTTRMYHFYRAMNGGEDEISRKELTSHLSGSLGKGINEAQF